MLYISVRKFDVTVNVANFSGCHLGDRLGRLGRKEMIICLFSAGVHAASVLRSTRTSS